MNTTSAGACAAAVGGNDSATVVLQHGTAAPSRKDLIQQVDRLSTSLAQQLDINQSHQEGKLELLNSLDEAAAVIENFRSLLRKSDSETSHEEAQAQKHKPVTNRQSDVPCGDSCSSSAQGPNPEIMQWHAVEPDPSNAGPTAAEPVQVQSLSTVQPLCAVSEVRDLTAMSVAVDTAASTECQPTPSAASCPDALKVSIYR